MNKKPSFDGLDEPLRTSLDWLTNRKTSIDEATSGETKSEMVMSKRFLEEAHNFNFDIPISSSPAAFVHADEIFSDGQIIPVYVDPSKIEVFRTSNSVPAIPISSLSSRSIVCPADRSHCHFLRKWRKSSKRILQKCFGCIRPLCRNAGCSRKSIKIDDIDSKVWEVKSWSNSPQTSPGQSEAYSSTDDRCDIKSKGKRIAGLDRTLRKVKSWSNSPQASPRLSPSYSTGDWNDVESSIYEAILHCKKSFEGKENGSKGKGKERN
ncbi:hypothetical protein F0562_015033 [Nyssa sinensis]|uniref:Membrane-associated kinase regulator 6 n=1 Tax=Nyssa sinensis TaxID=561372 RepID=A0A5J4ZPU0_9ASTE|nr:hypothetical protein F0562_015033 [Nyssa sinensis]